MNPAVSSLLSSLLDALPDGALVFNARGEITHLNGALGAVLASDAERESVLAQMRRFALRVPPRSSAAAPGAVNSCDVQTTSTRYRLRGVSVEDPESGTIDRSVLIIVESPTARIPTADTLASRFNLTATEAAVALLLVQGRSNDAVARKLGISPHTARHHTESVLSKLDASSRAEAGAKILGTHRLSGPQYIPPIADDPTARPR